MTGAALAERTITSEKKYGQKVPVDIPTHVAGLLQFQEGAIGTIITSFDIFGDSDLPRIEIYGTQGILSVPDPNTFGGPVLYRLTGSRNGPRSRCCQDIARTQEESARPTWRMRFEADVRTVPAASSPTTYWKRCGPSTIHQTRASSIRCAAQATPRVRCLWTCRRIRWIHKPGSEGCRLLHCMAGDRAESKGNVIDRFAGSSLAVYSGS